MGEPEPDTDAQPEQVGWATITLVTAILGVLTAISLAEFQSADGLEVLFESEFPSRDAYPDTIAGSIDHMWAQMAYLGLLAKYLLWGMLTLAGGYFTAVSGLATLCGTVLKSPLQILDQYGIETSVGDVTVGDTLRFAIVAAVPAAGIWYTQPYGPLESFGRAVGVFIALGVLVVTFLAWTAFLEWIGLVSEPDAE